MSNEMRFTAQEYSTLMNWCMVEDYTELTQLEQDRIRDMLNNEAKARNYDGWIDAYHDFGGGE